jgi:hypothetical protein
VTYAHYIRKLFTALFKERDRPTPAKAPLEESYFMNDAFAGVRCLIFMNVLTSKHKQSKPTSKNREARKSSLKTRDQR